MPPALSDYDFSFESDTDTNEAPASKTQVLEIIASGKKKLLDPEHAWGERVDLNTVISRKRKRGGLLSGLDVGNIVVPSDDIIISTAEDSVPASSVPPSSHMKSSHMTRGSTRGTRSNNLAYNQKYHPMDEYLRPSQAAKRRAEHGLDDEDNDSANFEEQDNGDSDSEVEDLPQMKKRKKLDKFALHQGTQGTRRSSRSVNRDVLYDMNIHPQDSQLEHMTTDSTVDKANDENDDIVSIGSSAATEEVDKPEVRERLDDASHWTASSPPRSTPLSTISIDNLEQPSNPIHTPQIDERERSSLSPRLQQTPFAIHEEPLQVQLAKEATATVPIDHEHDDKENPVEERDSYMEQDDQYLDPSMFDGANDLRGVSSHHKCRPRTPVQVNDFDSDSVLGSDTDSIIGD
ncbi:uncharacterized protein N0V89_007062 [Didymosphaeria variabile]|uniref:Uncharacterized protein n=1 Tax=Didymosphaeria variabile TaxID=1932322 RepID=A0A9W8XIR4_9PLEO|nr:uncharacterized protein N0V89_007062 [Didymosphaeria variabile]KAJ4351719.1 hypothetical protein N0V89_007062 [Didymosphaeria variabile]